MHQEEVIHNDVFICADQRREYKRKGPEHGNSFDDVSCFSVGHASGSSSTLKTALTRIDDAKEASSCRDRVHAVGFNLGTSRKVHKLRDISSSLCIDVNRLTRHLRDAKYVTLKRVTSTAVAT